MSLQSVLRSLRQPSALQLAAAGAATHLLPSAVGGCLDACEKGTGGAGWPDPREATTDHQCRLQPAGESRPCSSTGTSADVTARAQHAGHQHAGHQHRGAWQHPLTALGVRHARSFPSLSTIADGAIAMPTGSSLRGQAVRGVSSSSSAGSRASADEVGILREQAQARVAGRNRFYKTVEVKEAPGGQGGFSLFLGKYPIRTPGKRAMVLPTQALAMAVAAEWEWQESSKPGMHSMPLMGLVATAIDQPKPRDKVMESLLKYIHTDSALCRYEPGPIAKRQAQVFDPIIEWARTELGWTTLHSSDSIFGTQQDAALVESARILLTGLNSWELAAVEQLTYCGKSLLLALAMFHGKVGLSEGLAAARHEELFQTEEWGEVEAGHDLDKADIGSRMAAPVVLMRLLRVV